MQAVCLFAIPRICRLQTGINCIIHPRTDDTQGLVVSPDGYHLRTDELTNIVGDRPHGRAAHTFTVVPEVGIL